MIRSMTGFGRGNYENENREYIVNNYKIEGIMDTSKYDFLGADIETIVLHVKNQKVENQRYFY